MSHRIYHMTAAALIVVVACLLYAFTVPFPFVFDDYIYLVNNPLAQNPRSFGFLFDFNTFANASTRMGLDPDLSTNFILRPFAYLSFYANIAFDGLRPHYFRLVNIFVHILNAMFLYALLHHLLERFPEPGGFSRRSARFIALTAAMLFLAHPLQTESVTYIIQRFTSLGTFFFLATLLAFFWADLARHRWQAKILRALSVLVLLLGMLTKEFVFLAPFFLVLMERYCFKRQWKESLRRAAPHLCCLPIIPALMAATAIAQHGGVFDPGNVLNIANSTVQPIAPHEYALTQPAVVLRYLRMLVVPIGLNIDPHFPQARHLLQPGVLTAIITLALIAASAWTWQRRRPLDLHARLTWCGVFWFFACLSPDSSFVPLPDVMAEHRTYLPSIGFFLAASALLDYARTRIPFTGPTWAHPVLVGTVLWALALGGGTVARNVVWRSNVSMWRDSTRKSPAKWRPWQNLGAAYYEAGRIPEAYEATRNAMRLQPLARGLHQNLSMLASMIGRHQEAADVCLAGLQMTPDNVNLHFNLGIAFKGLGQTAQSVDEFCKVVSLDPSNQAAYLNLGLLYARLGQLQQAVDAFRRAGDIRPLGSEAQREVAEIQAKMMQPPDMPVTPAR